MYTGTRDGFIHVMKVMKNAYVLNLIYLSLGHASLSITHAGKMEDLDILNTCSCVDVTMELHSVSGTTHSTH